LIDDAESLVDCDSAYTNLAKVEYICKSVQNRPYAHKIVGIVDRMLRDFRRASSVEDTLRQHKVMGRLIWTRGHSIENYFFQVAVLREVMWSCSHHEATDEFLEAYTAGFKSALLLTSA
jgi:hypothetical protein